MRKHGKSKVRLIVKGNPMLPQDTNILFRKKKEEEEEIKGLFNVAHKHCILRAVVLY